MKNYQKIVAISLSTAPLAALADTIADILLVGDSLAMTLFNLSSTRSIDIPTITRHGKAVADAASHPLIIIDMPYLSYNTPEKALLNAQNILQHTHAHAVKIEGGAEYAHTIQLLVQHNIPVCGHIGLLPQSVEPGQKFSSQGHTQNDKNKLIQDALSVQEAGAFTIVLEAITEPLAQHISKILSIPTIGIGASPHCDGQILVAEDMIGLSTNIPPRFVKQYAHVHQQISHAFQQYAHEVRDNSFPQPSHCYSEKR